MKPRSIGPVFGMPRSLSRSATVGVVGGGGGGLLVIPHPRHSSHLYAEEQVPDLINHLLVAARLAAGEALEGGQHEVRWVLEVEGGLHALEVVGRLGGE